MPLYTLLQWDVDSEWYVWQLRWTPLLTACFYGTWISGMNAFYRMMIGATEHILSKVHKIQSKYEITTVCCSRLANGSNAPKRFYFTQLVWWELMTSLFRSGPVVDKCNRFGGSFEEHQLTVILHWIYAGKSICFEEHITYTCTGGCIHQGHCKYCGFSYGVRHSAQAKFCLK